MLPDRGLDLVLVRLTGYPMARPTMNSFTCTTTSLAPWACASPLASGSARSAPLEPSVAQMITLN